MKREIGLFARYDGLSRRRQRRQGVPDGFQTPSAVMAELMQHIIYPRVLGPVILGPDRLRHGPNMLTGVIKIQDFDPGLPGHTQVFRALLPDPVRPIGDENCVFRSLLTGNPESREQQE